MPDDMSAQHTFTGPSHAGAAPSDSFTFQVCPLLQKVAKNWGNDRADWLPSGITDISDIENLPNAAKQLLVELAEKSGLEGRATALDLMAESARRGRPRGGQALCIHPADIRHALTHFTTTDRTQPEPEPPAAPFVHRGVRRQRSPSTDSSNDDEPAPQRRRLEQATTTRDAAPNTSAPAATEAELNELLALQHLAIYNAEDKLKKLQDDHAQLAADHARLQAENTQYAKLAGVFCAAWQTAAAVTRKRSAAVPPAPAPAPLTTDDIDAALDTFADVRNRLAPFLPEGFRTIYGMGLQFDRLVVDALEFEEDEDDFDEMFDDGEEDEDEVLGYGSDPEEQGADVDGGAAAGRIPLRFFPDELVKAKKGTESQWVVGEDEDEDEEEMDYE